jgi:hypothetical protein
MGTVWVLFLEEPDTYDVGTHMEVLEIFAEREDAERARGSLIGKPKNRSWPHSSSVWEPYDLEIEERKVR